MAANSEKTALEQQGWDMEFKDPFSLEEDELAVYCSTSISQPPVGASSRFSEGHFTVATVSRGIERRVVTNSSPTIVPDIEPTAGLEFPGWTENLQRQQLGVEANARSSTRVSIAGSKGQLHVDGQAIIPCSKQLSTSTDTELRCSDMTVMSSEEQSPIPVMLSSAKRFCAGEIAQNNEASKHGDGRFRSLRPSAIHNDPPVRFTPPPRPLNAYSIPTIPTWPAVCLPLPVSHSGAGLQLRPSVSYNYIPYSRSTNIPVLYNQSSVRAAETHWPGSRIQLQTMLTKPPPPVPDAVISLSPDEFPVHSAHLQNGLTPHRLSLATVPQVVAPFPPRNIGRLPFSTSSHSIRPHSVVSGLAKAGLPVVSTVPFSTRGQALRHGEVQKPVLLSTNAEVTSERSRCSLPVTRVSSSAMTCTGLPVSSSCPLLTSSQLTSKQATCGSNVTPPPVKFSSTFAQLDPRRHNGNRQKTVAASSQSSAFVVPLPPPLPSLEELTSDSSDDKQTDIKTATGSSTSQSSTTGSTTPDTAKPDKVKENE